jgi:uncharacterized protein (UPF0335 family)
MVENTTVKVYADGEISVSDPVIAGDRLRSFIERIERLTEEKKGLAEDIKEVFSEAKGNGFDPKIIKAIIKIRSLDPNDREEEETLIDLYLSALNET